MLEMTPKPYSATNPICGKIAFHEIGPWVQKVRGPPNKPGKGGGESTEGSYFQWKLGMPG